MKKLLFVLALTALIATGAAFADHPGGLGIGIQGGFGGNWSGGALGSPALSLKVPRIPIFWAIRLDISPDYAGLGVSGDYYFIHSKLVPDINLHWYLGVGGYLRLGSDNPARLGVGARVPVGLSWQPIPLLEVFLQLVPSLGASLGFSLPPDFRLDGGYGGDIGIRIWL